MLQFTVARQRPLSSLLLPPPPLPTNHILFGFYVKSANVAVDGKHLRNYRIFNYLKTIPNGSQVENTRNFLFYFSCFVE